MQALQIPPTPKAAPALQKVQIQNNGARGEKKKNLRRDMKRRENRRKRNR
jgi:hypothetical protein